MSNHVGWRMRFGILTAVLLWISAAASAQEPYPFSGAFAIYPHDVTHPARRKAACLSSFHVQTKQGRYKFYHVDLLALAEEDRLAYQIHEEGICRYDAASGIDACQTTFDIGGKLGETFLRYDPKNFTDTPVFIARSKQELPGDLSGDPPAWQLRCPMGLSRLKPFLTTKRSELRPEVVDRLVYGPVIELEAFHNIIRAKLGILQKEDAGPRKP